MAHRTHQPITGFAGVHGDRRAVTLIELLVVLAVALILLASASSLYVSSRKAGDLQGDIMKVQKVLATARSYAISSPDRSYQVTFWPDRSLFWIDEIQVTAPADKTTTILRPKLVSPEPTSDQVVLIAVTGSGVIKEILTSTDGSTTNVYHVRFFSDGSSDDASVYLIRKEADRAGSNYQKIRVYAPTAQTRLFQNQPAP